MLIAVALGLAIALPTLFAERPWHGSIDGAPLETVHGDVFAPPFASVEWLEAALLTGNVTVLDVEPADLDAYDAHGANIPARTRLEVRIQRCLRCQFGQVVSAPGAVPACFQTRGTHNSRRRMRSVGGQPSEGRWNAARDLRN